MPFKLQPNCCCGSVTPPCLAANCPGKTWPPGMTATVTANGSTAGCCGVTSVSFALAYSDSINDGLNIGPGYFGSVSLDCADCTLFLWMICTSGFVLDVQLSGGACGCDVGPTETGVTEDFGVLDCTPFHRRYFVDLTGPCDCHLVVDITE